MGGCILVCAEFDFAFMQEILLLDCFCNVSIFDYCTPHSVCRERTRSRTKGARLEHVPSATDLFDVSDDESARDAADSATNPVRHNSQPAGAAVSKSTKRHRGVGRRSWKRVKP